MNNYKIFIEDLKGYIEAIDIKRAYIEKEGFTNVLKVYYIEDGTEKSQTIDNLSNINWFYIINIETLDEIFRYTKKRN